MGIQGFSEEVFGEHATGAKSTDLNVICGEAQKKRLL